MKHPAQALAILDRAHVPPPGHPDLPNYKEWWHINIIDESSGLDLVVNLSLQANVHRAGGGRAFRIVLAHETSYGWTQDFVLQDGAAARPGHADLALDLDLGGASLAPQDQTLVLTLPPSPGTAISGQITLTPRADPLMIWKNTRIGTGRINWFLVPRLQADGQLVVGGRPYVLTRAPAYHDHNWGAWVWGDNFGWDWGFCTDLAETPDGMLSMVYDRTTDKNGLVSLEHSLALWLGARLTCFFSRPQLQVRPQGSFAGPVRRIPGLTGLIDPARPVGIPAALEMDARDGANWISARYVPEQALQIAIPASGHTGMAELNETLGLLVVAGQIGDQAFSTQRRACFEFLR